VVTGYTHIADFGGPPAVLVANKDIPSRNLAEFVAYAKASPRKLNAAVVQAWQEPDTRHRLARDAIDPPTYDVAAFAEFYRTENERWGPLARQVIGVEK